MTLASAFAHPAFLWLGQPAMTLDVYGRLFNGAQPQIMGESSYLNAQPAGISFALTAEHSIKAIFFYAQGVEDFAQFGETLPAGLSFSNNRAEVRAALGDAAFSGEAGGVGIMAIDFAFDRFEHGSHYLRFEYAPGDSAVRLVTIGNID
jgi:hypothetical protein